MDKPWLRRSIRWIGGCELVSLLLLIASLAIIIVAVVRAGQVHDDLQAAMQGLDGAAIAQLPTALGRMNGRVALPCFASALDPLPADWIVVGDAFALGGSDNSTAWWNVLLRTTNAADGGSRRVIAVEAYSATDDGSQNFATLAARLAARPAVASAIAAQRPLLIFVSFGYEKLLGRFATPDALFNEVAAAFATQPALVSNPASAVVVVPRPLPLGSLSTHQYVPAAALPCGSSRAGQSLNQPPSVDQAATLAKSASQFPTLAFGLALAPYPAKLGAADVDGLFARASALSPSGPFAQGSCLYLSASGNALLADYLGSCLAGQTYQVPSQ